MTARLWMPARRLPGHQVALWVVLAVSLSLAVFSLVWLAYQAVNEWRRSTVLLVDQRSEEALTLLTVALSRDMKGVHNSVLATFDESSLDLDRPYELEDLFAQAFARFPYPESFFVWRDGPSADGSTFVFNRVDRQPPWATDDHREGAYPVVSLRDAAIGRDLATRARRLGASRRRFGTFDVTLQDIRYQIVVRLLYHTVGDHRLFGAVGFSVNLPWVSDHYFPEILRQISAIGNVEGSLSLAVSDEAGAIQATTRSGAADSGILHSRRFPLSFLDPDLLSGRQVDAADAPEWTASVSAGDDRTLAAASRGSARTLWLISFASATAMLALLLTLRALRPSAALAEMQSEFMASATHELKTPLALFQLVAETLEKGRYHSAETIRTYAGLLSNQSHLLERLVDNLLSYASLSHVTQRYNFAPRHIAEIVESALERFDARLVATGTEVKVDLSRTLPQVNADRQTMLQVFDNIIDNALKYSPQGEVLIVRSYVSRRDVCVEVTDRGPGIPVGERQKVFEKFYRGQGTTVGGSGLGLAIARRVVVDHGGQIEILGALPTGTTVLVRLPAIAMN